MKRAELEHVLRAATTVADEPEVLVIGSQSILGSADEERLPALATASMEVDIAFVAGGETTSPISSTGYRVRPREVQVVAEVLLENVRRRERASPLRFVDLWRIPVRTHPVAEETERREA